MTALRWGVLSTSSIASMVVRATRGSELTHFVAAASRGADRAERFAAEHGVERGFGSDEELLASDDVDAVYVAQARALEALRTSYERESPVSLAAPPTAVSSA